MDRLDVCTLRQLFGDFDLPSQMRCRKLWPCLRHILPLAGQADLNVQILKSYFVKKSTGSKMPADAQLLWALQFLLPRWAGSLQSIDLTNCLISERILELITAVCPHLQSLTVSPESFYDKNDRDLTIEFTRNGRRNLSSGVIERLIDGRINGGWPQLTELRLDRIIDLPSVLPQTLRKLELNHRFRSFIGVNVLTPSSEVPLICPNLTNLKLLEFDGNFQWIIEMHNLTDLDIQLDCDLKSYTRHTSLRLFEELSTGCPRIRRLRLVGIHYRTILPLSQLDLEYLELKRCSFDDWTLLPTVVKPSTKDLVLKSCPTSTVTGITLAEMAKNCGNLERLKWNCFDYEQHLRTPRAMANLVGGCTQLKSLSLDEFSVDEQLMTVVGGNCLFLNEFRIHTEENWGHFPNSLKTLAEVRLATGSARRLHVKIVYPREKGETEDQLIAPDVPDLLVKANITVSSNEQYVCFEDWLEMSFVHL